MKKQCKRKVWRKGDMITQVVRGLEPLPESVLDILRIGDLAAIAAFSSGKASIFEWQQIAQILNLAETFARNGVGPEVLEACKEAEKHLIEAAQRYERSGRMGMTGLGLQALRSLYQFHDLQRQSVTRGEYEKTIKATGNRIRGRAPEVTEIV